MSVRSVQQTGTTNHRRLADGGGPEPTPWVRNPTWLPMPATTPSDEQVDILVRINQHSNYVALNCTCTGGYTVVWGDGTSQNVASTIQVDKLYDFSNVAFDGTNGTVTFQDSGDTVTRNSHGYTDGMQISFDTVVTTTGITPGVPYFVISATLNTFQLSETAGGSAIALTTDGTGTILPYKQALIRITPQVGGNLLTAVSLKTKNSTANLSNYSQPWLDITVSAGVNGLGLGSSGGLNTPHLVERVTILRTGAAFIRDQLFMEARNLRMVSFPNGLSGANTANSMFTNCSSLEEVPAMDLSNVISATGMFGSCRKLRKVADITWQVSSYDGLFSGCSSLRNPPQITNTNSTRPTITANMFSQCDSLVTAPLLNMANVTNASNMFFSCSSLENVPDYNMPVCTDVTQMFRACATLKRAPALRLPNSNVTATSLFHFCRAMISVPPTLNLAGVTNANNMFQACLSLSEVPSLNFGPNLTNASQLFDNCWSLTAVPLFNTVNVTTMSQMFANCRSLTTVPLFNTVNVTNMSQMFSGSAQASGIVSVPRFNTSNVTNMNSMFATCPSLSSVPMFDTTKVTDFTSMFSGCSSLVRHPGLNSTAAVTGTGFTNMFQTCSALQSIGPMNMDRAALTSGAYSNMFSSCTSLSDLGATGFRRTFSISGCKLSGPALDALYTSLPTVTSQTVTVTGNVGIATDTPSIATAKGWGVTGS